MSEPETPVRLVQIWLCDLCLNGAGGECHTPGCALWINRAPDLPLRNSPFVTILDAPSAEGGEHYDDGASSAREAAARADRAAMVRDASEDPF